MAILDKATVPDFLSILYIQHLHQTTPDNSRCNCAIIYKQNLLKNVIANLGLIAYKHFENLIATFALQREISRLAYCQWLMPTSIEINKNCN